MKHIDTTMVAAFALTSAMVTTSANAETDFTPYIGFAAEMRSDIDPNDYKHVARKFTTRRDGSGAAGVYVGVRRGRLGLEGGWMFEKTTRWSNTETDAMGRETIHRAEIEAGGPYIAATVDVLAVSDAQVYLKGGLARGNRWKTTLDDQTTGSGGSGTITTTGAGVRLELTESGLELRAEVILHHDSDIGTKGAARGGLSYRF